MQMHVHVHHHIEFDESSEFVKMVRAVHQNQLLLLQGNEVIMAQLDDLMNALQTISSDVDSEVSRLQQLQDQLTALQNSTPAEVDLQPAIDLANSIRSRLEGTVTVANTVADPAGNSDTTTQSSGADTSSSGSSSDAGSSSGDFAGDPSVQPPADVTSGDSAGGTDSIPQSE